MISPKIALCGGRNFSMVLVVMLIRCYGMQANAAILHPPPDLHA
jgi:hypothetical protein